MNSNTLRWAAVILLPLALTAWSILFPAAERTDYLINGIILSCACVFLAKAVLFAFIGAHLKQQAETKRQALLQLLPLATFAAYIVWYFVH